MGDILVANEYEDGIPNINKKVKRGDILVNKYTKVNEEEAKF